jgi:arylsulfatase A-like enzyme
MHVNDLERLWRRPAPNPKWDTFFEPRKELSAVPPVAEADPIYFAVPRSRWSGGSLTLGEYEALYDGALRELDGKLGRLFERMRRSGRLFNTTVVIVGTYGLSLGESGLILDTGTLSDADLSVPLIIRPSLALQCARKNKTEQLVSLMDVAPTLLDMAGIAQPKGMHGVSQYGVLQGADEPTRTYAFASGGLQAGFVVFDARHCYERSVPAYARPGSLSTSWYGDGVAHRHEVHTFLHDRQANPSRSHLLDSDDDRETADRMLRAGEDWFTWVYRASKVLQEPPDPDEDRNAPMFVELRRRGLISDAR